MTSQVAEAQQLQNAYQEDEATLLLHVHAVKAALESSVKEKSRTSQHFEQTREDWAKKLRDRHTEVQASNLGAAFSFSLTQI